MSSELVSALADSKNHYEYLQSWMSSATDETIQNMYSCALQICETDQILLVAEEGTNIKMAPVNAAILQKNEILGDLSKTIQAAAEKTKAQFSNGLALPYPSSRQ